MYELTRPRLWTFDAAVAEIARVTRRSIRFEQVSARLYARQLEAAGVPPDVVGLVLYLFAEVLDGRNASVTSDVASVLGRTARDFSENVQVTASTGLWNVAESTQSLRPCAS